MDDQFFTFKELARRVVDENWGRAHKSEKEAVKELLKSVDLTSCLLLFFADRFERVVAILWEDIYAKKLSEYRLKAERELNEWISQREAKHGQCPATLEEWIRRDHDLRTCRHWCGWGEWDRGNLWVPDVFPPDKGTEIRREYDKWMRRKPKAQHKKRGPKKGK